MPIWIMKLLLKHFLFWLWCVNSILTSNNKNATLRFFCAFLTWWCEDTLFGWRDDTTKLDYWYRNFAKNESNRKCVVIVVPIANTFAAWRKKKSQCKHKVFAKKNPNELKVMRKSTKPWISDFIGGKHKYILISFVLCIYFSVGFLHSSTGVEWNFCGFSKCVPSELFDE